MTVTLELTEDLLAFVHDVTASGGYQDASEVVRDALRHFRRCPVVNVPGESRVPDADPSDLGDALYERLLAGEHFWTLIHEAYMNRDLNRMEVKRCVRRLLASAGNYREVITLLRLPKTDYQRFMDFLRHQDLKPD